MKEEDIRKRDIFNQYLKIVEEDIKIFFNNSNLFIERPCPACDSGKNSFQFEKIGFNYVLCDICRTLFVTPCPSFESLNKFYIHSRSTKFWVNEFFKPVAEVRREKIFKPRAEYVAKRFSNESIKVVADIGAGFGLFLKELSKIWPTTKLITIEPSKEMSDICRNEGFDVISSAIEDIDGYNEKFDLLTAFELGEHLYNPFIFAEKALSLLRPGGRLFMTTLNGEGFDIQLLWNRSKSVSPPFHLNFFNTNSIKILLERVGFTIDEVSTPGKLDWDIVEGMIKHEGIEPGRFWKLLSEKGNEEVKKEFQEWVSKHNLSSHMRIIACK